MVFNVIRLWKEDTEKIAGILYTDGIDGIKNE